MNKVLIEISVYWWNAEAQYAFNLGLALREKGCEIRFFTERNSLINFRLRDAGFEWSEAGRKQLLGKLRTLKTTLEEHSVHTVFSFSSKLHPLFYILKKLRSRPFRLVRVRANAKMPRNHFLNRILHEKNGADHFVCANAKILQGILRLGRDRRTASVVYYGTPPLPAGRPSEKEKIFKRLGLPENTKLICMVGRNQRIKGHFELIEALLVRGDADPFRYLFLIKDLEEFPEELKALRNELKKLPADKVKICGWLENLSEVLRFCHFGVVASQGSEAVCRVAVEFMSLGVPVLSTPVGALPEIIRDGENGFLLNGTSSEAIAEGLLRCAKTGEAFRKQMGLTAQKDYRSRYSLSAMGAEIRKVIHSLPSLSPQ